MPLLRTPDHPQLHTSARWQAFDQSVRQRAHARGVYEHAVSLENVCAQCRRQASEHVHLHRPYAPSPEYFDRAPLWICDECDDITKKLKALGIGERQGHPSPSSTMVLRMHMQLVEYLWNEHMSPEFIAQTIAAIEWAHVSSN